MRSQLSILIFCSLVSIVAGCGATKNDSESPVVEAKRGPDLATFSTKPIGNGFQNPPKISQVEAVDIDLDGTQDILICDCEKNLVSWLKIQEDGNFEENVVATEIPAPARAHCVDLDQDGDQDIVVAVLGVLFPNNDPIGSLELFENDGNQNFSRRTLLRDVARVADVRSGDLNKDGKLDLVVTHFGYYQGKIQWLRNLGDWRFESRSILDLPGGIHGVVSDMDNDGNPDITAVISQDSETVLVFRGDGDGNFEKNEIFKANTSEYGSSGIWLDDLDQDGDTDVIYTNGDAFDYSPPHPWPWHGIQWFENLGGLKFEFHRLANFGGAVSAHVVDFDQDNDKDIFVASTFNDWDDPRSNSLLLLENVGAERFVRRNAASNPTHLQTITSADFDDDGKIELVTGGMHVSEPYDRVQRVTLWDLPDTAGSSKQN